MYVVDTVFTEEDLNLTPVEEDNIKNISYVCKKCGNEVSISSYDDVIEFNLYDSDSVRVPAIQCKETGCPIGLLKIQGVWLTIDEVLKSGKDRSTGFQKVTTIGERIILSVLNNIVYKVLDCTPDDPGFLPHAFDEYAKLLWIKNTAVGFYTVKEKGTWCGSQAQALSWHMSVLDTVYINSSHRRQGYGLLVIDDFLKTFPGDKLGISEPVSESMLLVCKRFIKDNPCEAERLWLCTLPADKFNSKNLVLQLALSGMSGKLKKRKNSEPKKFITDVERTCDRSMVGSSSGMENECQNIQQDSSEGVDTVTNAPSANYSIDNYDSSSNLLRNFSVIAKATIDGQKSKDTVRKVSTPILPIQTLLKNPENFSETVDENNLPEVFNNETYERNEINPEDVDEGNAIHVPRMQETDDYQHLEEALNSLPELTMDNDDSQGTSHDTERSQSPSEFTPVADDNQYYVKSEPIDEDDYEKNQNLMTSKQKNLSEEEPSSSSVVIKQEPASVDEQTLPLHGGNQYLFTMQGNRFKSDSFDEINDQPLNQVLEAQIDAELSANDSQNPRKLTLFEQMLLPSGPQEQGSSEDGQSILQNLNQSQGMISSLLRNIAEQLKEPKTSANREPIWQTKVSQKNCEAQSSSNAQNKLRKTTYPIAKLSTHLVKRKQKYKTRSDHAFYPRGIKSKDMGSVFIEGPSKRTRSHSSSNERVNSQLSNLKRIVSEEFDNDDEEMDSSSSSKMTKKKATKANNPSNSHQCSTNQLSRGCSMAPVHSSTIVGSLRNDFHGERPERPKRPFNVVQAMTVEGPSSTERSFPQGSLYESLITSDSQQSLHRRTHMASHGGNTSSLSSSHDRPRHGAQNPLIRGLLEMKVPTKRTLIPMKPMKKTTSIMEDASTSHDVSSAEHRINLNTMSTQTGQYVCELCDIIFTDSVMYVLHTGCHGRQDAYQCNQCGTICRDKYEFMIHFIQGVHSRE